MANILYRASTAPTVPGSTTAKTTPLTNLEIDGNFKSLNDELILKAPLASPTFTGTVGGITAAMVGAPAGSGTSTGTNTGDQASIVGITGTIAQFNTAVTDADLATLAGAETLANKTIAYASNTLTGVQPTLASGTNIKTINGATVLGAGDIAITGITPQATGFTATGGTTPKTLTVDEDMTTSQAARRNAANTFTGAQIGGVTALTSTAAAIAINLATNNNFSHTTSENTTLSAPSNPVAGQSGVITITQGATARTLAYNTFWKFAGGTIPTLTATVGAVDVFAYNVESATRATAQLIKDVK
jgi:hypothetical protein